MNVNYRELKEKVTSFPVRSLQTVLPARKKHFLETFQMHPSIRATETQLDKRFIPCAVARVTMSLSI